MEIDEYEKIILESFFDGLRPIPRMTVSEWANAYRMLNSTSSSEPGPYRYERTPYLRKIMDYLGVTSDIQEIAVMKGAQLGFTDAGNNWIGYTMHIDPGPMLLVMPTEGALKKNSRTRIEPMIEGTPVLKERTGRKGEKGTVNTILEKEFPGGFLMMVAAQSPVGLSSTPVGKIMMDEIDRYPDSAGDEGSPVELARARARTFSSKKIYYLSTPTIEGESLIDDEFRSGDCQYYNVLCLACGELFVITWDCIVWDEGKPETTRCACSKCGFLHEERHKTKMFAEKGFSPSGKAEWISTKKSDNPKKVSLHLSALYSPAGFYSWEDAVRDYLKIQNSVNNEKTFVNTVLGETYKISGESPDFDNLYNRREDYEIGTVPQPAYFLTIGADIQRDRIECEVVGWCKGRETYSVEYGVYYGDTSDLKSAAWNGLREAISKLYPHDDGSLMPVSLTCVDSSDGPSTKTVYDFCAEYQSGKVVPIKGMDSVKDVMVSTPKIVNVSSSGKKIGRAKVWGVGVSLIKSELYGYLKLKASVNDDDQVSSYPAGYCHFPMYDMSYFKMLTAEEHRLIVNKKTKKHSYEWVKTRERNEALDCRVYARAAAYIIGVDRFKDSTWDQVKAAAKVVRTTIDAPAKKKKKKSSYWDRN